MSIIISVFLRGYSGKTINFTDGNGKHRTTIAYFLNHGKWNESALEDTLKSTIIQIIYKEAQLPGQPIFCIVDDTIASHTKPLSQAVPQSKLHTFTNPIEKAARIMGIRLFPSCFPVMG